MLKVAWKVHGFETKSVKHNISWWRTVRHKDIKSVKSGIYQEHIEQFKNLDIECQEKFSK